MLWSHIPKVSIVPSTSSISQNESGNHFGSLWPKQIVDVGPLLGFCGRFAAFARAPSNQSDNARFDGHRLLQRLQATRPLGQLSRSLVAFTWFRILGRLLVYDTTVLQTKFSDS